VYTEVIKLDDLSADPKGEVDPRYELDLTVNVRPNLLMRRINKYIIGRKQAKELCV
jgi:hypothetical protein